MTWQPNYRRNAGLGLAGVSRGEVQASAMRAAGQSPPPELASARMRPRPRERAAAAAWGERHRQLALAALHRWMAAELDAGRWPQPLGLGNLRTFTRDDFRAVLVRLRGGVGPTGAPLAISPVLAGIDIDGELAEVERRASDELG